MGWEDIVHMSGLTAAWNLEEHVSNCGCSHPDQTPCKCDYRRRFYLNNRGTIEAGEGLQDRGSAKTPFGGGTCLYVPDAGTELWNAGDDFTIAGFAMMRHKSYSYIFARNANTDGDIKYSIGYDKTCDRIVFETHLQTFQQVKADNWVSPIGGEYFFFCAWYWRNENALYLQINDIEPDRKINTDNLNRSPQTVLSLGGCFYSNAAYLRGDICNVTFWKRRLSHTERLKLYNEGQGKFFTAKDL